jgi:hypothetical protein
MVMKGEHNFVFFKKFYNSELKCYFHSDTLNEKEFNKNVYDCYHFKDL